MNSVVVDDKGVDKDCVFTNNGMEVGAGVNPSQRSATNIHDATVATRIGVISLPNMILLVDCLIYDGK